MARCGCTGTTCSCKIVGRGAVVVTGAGTITNPYEISVSPAMQVQDTSTIDLTLLGAGTSVDPYILSATAQIGLGELADVDTTGGLVGYTLALQADGSWVVAPPVTAAVGAITVGNSLEGDGSGGDPLDVRLGALSGLEKDTDGLKLAPYTVTTEGDLDPTWGALPPGSIVADTDGLNAWLKSASGWKALLEDSGNVAVVAGNITARTGFTVTSFFARRKNGIVTMQIGLTTTISRTTSFDSGNIANINVADILDADFRPIVSVPLRVTSAGTDDGFYLTTSGVLAMANLAQPNVTIPAGYTWVIAGTWIGQG